MKADPVWSAACARRVDDLSSNTCDIPQSSLMERAGAAVAAVARKSGTSFLVLAGRGNNGGDALVAARLLSADPTLTVTTIKVGDGAVEVPHAPRFDCIIDGIFGLGFRGPLDLNSAEGRALRAAATIKQRDGATVVAVDLPSGLTCDDPSQDEAPLPADQTVTFGALKAVHAISPARDLCGKVHCVDIGFSDAAIAQALEEEKPVYGVIRLRDLLADNPWARLPAAAHKYDRGHVLVAGGSPGKTGAPVLSALASLRAGAGWATIAIPDAIMPHANIPPDLTSESLFARGRSRSGIDPRRLEHFVTTRKVRSMVIGPGTMENPLGAKSLAFLCEFSREGFVVMDAGALQGIVDLLTKHRLEFKPGHAVFTPHPGEWTRMSRDKWPAPMGAENVLAVEQACADLGVHVVYKHSTPVLCGPAPYHIDGDGNVRALVFNEGSNAMGRAGTGDVLAGCIAAHGAIGCEAPQAVMRSLAVVTSAARLAAGKVGFHAVLPTDILGLIGKV